MESRGQLDWSAFSTKSKNPTFHPHFARNENAESRNTKITKAHLLLGCTSLRLRLVTRAARSRVQLACYPDTCYPDNSPVTPIRPVSSSLLQLHQLKLSGRQLLIFSFLSPYSNVFIFLYDTYPIPISTSYSLHNIHTSYD